MSRFVMCMGLVRVVLPASLSCCILFRQNGLSFIYLLLLLLVPMFKVPTVKTMAGATGSFLILVMVISVLATIAQLSFQIVLLAMPPYGEFITHCDMLEMILRHVGLNRLDNVHWKVIVRMIGPEILMLIISILVYVLCAKLVRDRRQSLFSADSSTAILPAGVTNAPNQHKPFVVAIGKYLTLLSLCVAGAMRPSVLSGVYYLVFLGSMTWWACYKELGKGFVAILRFVQFVSAVHLIALFAVQLQWVQRFLTDDCDYCRYLGLTQLIYVNCADPRVVVYRDDEWASFLNPVVLIWLNYIVAVEASVLLKSRLIRGMSAVKYKATVSDSRPGTIHQDALGSVTITEGFDDAIQLQSLTNKKSAPEAQPGLCDKVLDGFMVLLQVVKRSSYVATNIIMMAWSITYHSWITFVLLLWASILWILPNQRRYMLRCSPFLVLYAIFLLLAQYIYSMDLTDLELPQNVVGINLKQIGFVKPVTLPVNPILVKSLYTLLFWVTLRQFMQERYEARTSSTLEDMVAPLQITVGTATRGFEDTTEFKSPFMAQVGSFVKDLLTKFWIWVVAIMLFVTGVEGARMTVYRIIYMALFLVFILTFQLSYRLWRKILYPFWLTVIIYAMSILVLVYTYQFDNFPEYWEKYIGIPEDLQLDLGLERFETGELFIRLLAPTFFLVITVIQVHYFHKDFLAISDIKPKGTRQSSVRESNTYRSEGSSGFEQDAEEPLPKDIFAPTRLRNLPSLRDLKNISSTELHELMQYIKSTFVMLTDVVWCFLEIHIPKIMVLSIILLCVYDVSAVHFAPLLLIVVALSFGHKVILFATHVTAVFVSGMLLATMVYQFELFHHENHNVNCSHSDLAGHWDVTLNDADWLGFRKISSEIHLAYIIKGYIGLILLATILAVVNIRQQYKRSLLGCSLKCPPVMFMGVQRSHADESIICCIKYFFNYGFYKFGVEVSLMTTVALIATRMDIYAVLYSLWLVVLFSMKRETLARIWFSYQLFIMIVIPLQYVMAVGLPPGLCVDYPWYKSETLQNLQEWLFLPDPVHPPASYKIIGDCVLLLMVVRQSLVFRIEKRYENKRYPAGDNKDITAQAEQPGFVNPVPDFISYVRSFLDIMKRGILGSFLWITLAIVFLAGTNRVNLFSIGYLIGSFIFLWLGEELYLRPVNRIIRRWNCLLGYNVVVILSKTVLQITGCVFIKLAQQNACWVVQLMGISCIKKYTDASAGSLVECSVPGENTGLMWDGICFGFLIMMRRLFQSYYFLHMVDETKAMTILASRGAELIEELSLNQISEQQEEERNILEKIKLKMERIKATQQKVQGMLKEPESHYVAIRSGDYYMFEEFDDDLLEEDKDESSSDDEVGSKRETGVTLSKFLTVAMKTDMENATDAALRRSSGQGGSSLAPDVKKSPSAEGHRRASMPQLPRRQSSSFFTAQTQPSPPHRASSPSLTTHESLMESSKDGTSFQSAQFPLEKEAELSPGHTGGLGVDHAEPMSPQHPMSQFQQPDLKGTEKKPSFLQKIWRYIKFMWAFIESLMVTMTRSLNHFSRDYRYIVRVLSMEKKWLKENAEFGRGERTGSSMIWQPLADTLERRLIPRQQAGEPEAGVSGTSPEESSSKRSREVGKPSDQSQTLQHDSPQTRLSEGSGSDSTVDDLLLFSYDYGTFGGPSHLRELTKEQELSASDQSPFVRLLLAIWFAVMSHSDLLCYFMVFLHQIKSATILSVPLPLMVFLWGSLTVPRPTKTFWVTLIAYTEVIVIIKALFQFELLPWNQQVTPDNMPFFPPRIIGIERKDNYALYDLLLLLIIFFHRFMLKSLGLWKTTYQDPVTFPKKKEQFVVMEETGEKSNISKGSTTSLQSRGLRRRIVTESRRSMSSAHSDTVAVTRGGLRLCSMSGGETTDFDQAPEKIIIVQTETEHPLDHFPHILKLATERYFDSVKTFFKQLLTPSPRVTVDVYTYMFFCDFINILVVVFGFASFGTQQGDGGVTAYLEENKVPIPFLAMLILQFALIIIDRALFLRKYILGKIIFQFVLVVGIHIWMFFILPAVTERQFSAAVPPQMWYVVKSFYLLLSAYQIRSGYPTRILGNVLCKRYNLLNYITFKGFMIVPFLFEMRALMDWIWTDTSMTLMDWIKMEDIFAHIFQLKCARRMEAEYPQPRGEKKPSLVKYLMGGCFLLLIIAVIWFPLVLFALGNTVGEPNLPYDVTVDVRIGPYQPVYRMSAQNSSIHRLQEHQWAQMINMVYKKDRIAQTFLSGYDYPDVAVVTLSGPSTNVWDISPPDLERLKDEIRSPEPIVIRLTFQISRISNNPSSPGTITESQPVIMPATIGQTPNIQRVNLLEMLETTSNKSVIIESIFPKFVKVTNRGKAPIVTQLLPSHTEEAALRDLSMTLRRDTNSSQWWWELRETRDPSAIESVVERLPYFDRDKLVMYTFNERAFPSGLNILSGGGIIGYYAGIFLLGLRIFRGIWSKSHTIMFDEMPCVDRVLKLCLDIYLVRESGEFDLEEDLYAKLVFLYRSPETLIKWTRPREDDEDRGNLEQPAIAD